MYKIIIFMGLPASGKSLYAKKVSKKIKAVYLSSDILRKKLLEKKTYSESEKNKVYYKMISLIKLNAKKRNIVLDATFYKESLRKKFSDEAKRISRKIIFIEIKAKEKNIKNRMLRKRKDSDATYSIFKILKKEFQLLKSKHLVINSDKSSISENVKKIMAHLNSV